MWPVPGGMSRLQPGQRYVLFAWYGWIMRVSASAQKSCGGRFAIRGRVAT